MEHDGLENPVHWDARCHKRIFFFFLVGNLLFQNMSRDKTLLVPCYIIFAEMGTAWVGDKLEGVNMSISSS